MSKNDYIEENAEVTKEAWDELQKPRLSCTTGFSGSVSLAERDFEFRKIETGEFDEKARALMVEGARQMIITRSTPLGLLKQNAKNEGRIAPKGE